MQFKVIVEKHSDGMLPIRLDLKALLLLKATPMKKHLRM